MFFCTKQAKMHSKDINHEKKAGGFLPTGLVFLMTNLNDKVAQSGPQENLLNFDQRRSYKWRYRKLDR